MSESPNRRWFRWSLRTLFVVVIAAAIAAWVCKEWPVTESQRAELGVFGYPTGIYSTLEVTRHPTPMEVVVRFTLVAVAAIATGLVALGGRRLLVLRLRRQKSESTLS
jgi:hypothetical protein